MARLIFVTHPQVTVDPATPITRWSLSETGRQQAEVLSRDPRLARMTTLWSSAERKAQETAAIIASGLPVLTEADLGENDRSSTGYLPHAEFEAAADRFFAAPGESFRGWETADAAQKRIVDAVTRIAEGHNEGDLVIVSHGAVGTLLRCHLAGLAIDRRHDQPGQGHLWVATLPGLHDPTGWQPIA